MHKKLNEIFIGVYWGIRKQHIDDCAKQVSDFLIKLQDFDSEAFGKWFGKGWSKEEALEKKIDFTNAKQIKAFLLEKAKENEQEFSDIGYRLAFWNGKDSLEGMSISIHLGAFGGYSPNNALIEFPYTGSIHDIYKNEQRLLELVKFMANFWNAESVRINNYKMTIGEFNKMAK